MESLENFTEQKIKDTISFLKHMSEKAHNNAEKWNGTDTTYSDTQHLAADVEFGRAEAFEEAANVLWNLLPNPDDYQDEDDPRTYGLNNGI